VHLERLELRDYRSYRAADVDLGGGVWVIVGDNAQGKTNLVEAVHYLAVGHSHRVAADAPLVRVGAEAAVVRAVARLAADGPGRRLTVELEIRPGGRNRCRLNGQPQNRTREVIGRIRSVLFAPEDLQLVRGDPGERRRFLDDLLTQRRPAYAAARQDYERILRQRNALLKSARAARSGASRAPHPADTDARAGGDALDTWTAALARAGATLLAARIAAVHALAGPTEQAYRDLVAASPAREAAGRVVLRYELSTGRPIPADPAAGVPDPASLDAELREGFAAVAAAERERGTTLAGPHRDELFLGLNDLPAKGYASHGEHWSLALALRLASREVLHEVGEEPIVLLDDVFAELDEQRRERLAARCAGFEQVLVTAAVDGDVPLPGPRYRVRAGELTRDHPAGR